MGHTDTDDTTVLHVPSEGLVAAGDVVYNGVNQYLREAAGGGIPAWLSALDAVAALAPSAVVSGHKERTRQDSNFGAVSRGKDRRTTFAPPGTGRTPPDEGVRCREVDIAWQQPKRSSLGSPKS
jgi:glyoxylase-like metal-dependent hydrolase (beta-lactamase superfamily II)